MIKWLPQQVLAFLDISILFRVKADSLDFVTKAVFVMGHFGHEQFLFSFSFVFWLYKDFVFFFFFFSSGRWRDTWQGSHITGHMIWCHRPRTWWEDLEDDVRVYVYNMVALSRKWGKHEVEV